MTEPVYILPTGVANIASVRAALERAGRDVFEIASRDEIEAAPALVMPGVGTFGAAMQSLNEKCWIEPLRARLLKGKKTLAICVGLQVLCESSEESPGAQGLGIIPKSVQRLNPASLPVPQMGWNRVGNAYAYFANSYAICGNAVKGWEVDCFHYGSDYIAALRRGGVWACQFHPELSGRYGQDIIQQWLEVAC